MKKCLRKKNCLFSCIFLLLYVAATGLASPIDIQLASPLNIRLASPLDVLSDEQVL